jgi:hypothetical protein
MGGEMGRRSDGGLALRTVVSRRLIGILLCGA